MGGRNGTFPLPLKKGKLLKELRLILYDADINSLLNDLDFELLELRNFGRCAPMTLPIGFRGLEQPLYGEAVKLPKISQLFSHEQFQNYYGLKQDKSIVNKKDNIIREQSKNISLLINDLKEGDFSPLEIMKYRLNEVAIQVRKNRLFEIDIAKELCL